MNKQAIYQYLRINKTPDGQTEELIDECIEEVRNIARFKVTTLKCTLQHDPLMIKDIHLALQSDDLSFHFKNCNDIYIIGCTLGVEIDRKTKYYELIDMAKAIVFDAVASRYLEECCDEFEKENLPSIRTFRFAPGYGDLSIEYNHALSYALKMDKILGASINDGGLFLPMKTMVGLIGIGDTIKKSCLSCVRINNCELRKGKMRCYVTD